MSSTDILNSDELWLQAAKLCEYTYSLLDELPEKEEWGMQANLRKHAFILTNDVAEALGGDDPRNAFHSFNYALRDAYGLKNALTMAKRAKYITLDPDMMLLIDELAAGITTRQQAAQKGVQAYLKKFDPADSYEREQKEVKHEN